MLHAEMHGGCGQEAHRLPGAYIIGTRQKKRPCSRRGATVARSLTHSPPAVFLYLYCCPLHLGDL